MYDLCRGSLEPGQGTTSLPQQKSLEQILRQELAITLDQVTS